MNATDYKVSLLTERLRELEQKVEELGRTLDTAEAHIKFLENELCTVVADGHYSRARGEA